MRDARQELEDAREGTEAEAAAQSAAIGLLLSSVHEVEILCDVLPRRSARVDKQVRERIGAAGAAHFHPGPKAWLASKR